ncbi:cholecystokinin receptor type A-like [Liolophura sinensis]|uniref:cholecystokinin receptor type A-like n=1 Tax=Liolophura sinensis TaxID=3198878 RepID=UPI0031591CD2
MGQVPFKLGKNSTTAQRQFIHGENSNVDLTPEADGSASMRRMPIMNNTTIDLTKMQGYSNAELYAVLAILSLFSVLGTVGNALVIYVFGRRKEKLTSTVFILTLAGTDFITCLVIVPFTLVMEAIDFRIQYDFPCKLYKFLITSNVPFSAFIMVAIAVDRYLCICHPFLHAMNIFRAKVIIAALALLATTLGIITSLAFGVQMSEPVYNNATDRWVNQTVECDTNVEIISEEFRMTYQKVYAALFLTPLVIVGVLYGLIYRSVLMRRAARLRQKYDKASACAEHSVEETQMTVLNGNGNGETHENGLTVKEKRKRKASKKDRNRMANMRTACMLFVVTLVFVICFLPAWLMAHKIVPFSPIIFYMYFMYNVANPIIYAFMNQTFRDDLRSLFNCKTTVV